MKKQTQLQTYFTHALMWNGGSYVFYKISQTLVTFFLYAKLSLSDFMTWSIIHSWIFLIILLLSAGIKKAIPRYMPYFVTTKKTRSSMFYTSIFYTSALVGVCTFFLLWWSKKLSALFLLSYSPKLTYITAFLLFTEGIITLLETFYYAQFKNKFFNISKTACLLGELLSIACIGYFYTQSSTILLYIFLSKVCWRLLFMSFAFSRISYTTPFTENKISIQANQTKNATPRAFAQYSLYMWLTTALKSLTERNTLTPFIAITFGHHVAASSKLAHDCALLIYRIAIKTISNNDTALLAYSKTEPERLQSFKRLSHAIFHVTAYALLSSLLFLIACSFSTNLRSLHNAENSLVTLFSVMAIGYVIELIFSPFERLLEVTYQYKKMLVAYTPYTLITLFLGYYYLYHYSTDSTHTIAAVTVFFALVHAIRIITLVLMIIFVKKSYKKAYPWYLIFILGGLLALYTALLWARPEAPRTNTVTYRVLPRGQK